MNNTPVQKFEFPGFVGYSNMDSLNASMTLIASSESQVKNNEK